MAKKTAELTFLTAKSPYWQMDFVVEGERVCRSTRTADKKQAERIARAEWQAARDRAAERRKAVDRKDMTWGDGVASYLAYKGDYPSRRTDESDFAWLTEAIGRRTYLSQITHKVVVGLVAKRRSEPRWGRAGESGPGAYTVYGAVVAVIRKVLTYAKEDLSVHLPNEPNWKRLKVKPNPRIAELMVEQQAILMETGDREILDPAEFILETGLRRETALLTWDKVHLPEGIISIRTKGGVFHEVEITERVREILLRARARTQGKPGEKIFTFVARKSYVNPKNGKRYERGKRYPLTGGYFLVRWHALCREAGIGHLRIHDLRKTLGARIVRETGCLQSASMKLGHAGIGVTSIHYAHIRRKDVERRAGEATDKTRERIERLLRSNTRPDQPSSSQGA